MEDGSIEKMASNKPHVIERWNMFRSLDSLLEYKIQALDGETGNVNDFYFDGSEWFVRYLVVDTGPWILGRRVLITNMVIGEPDWDTQSFPVNLTKEEIRNSPDIDTQLPVSRQEEIRLEQHYHWPIYHHFPLTGGGIAYPAFIPGTKEEDKIKTIQEHELDLRRIREVKGYQVQGRDGKLGVLEDCIVDDQTWEISYLLVNTGEWQDGKRVIISPRFWVKEISYHDQQIQTMLLQQHILDSPAFDIQLPAEEIQIR
jgi:sporulation protein YlmC with PRC-barrel domain